MDRDTLLYLKRITSKDRRAHGALLDITRGLGGDWISVYVWLSPFALPLKLSQHC